MKNILDFFKTPVGIGIIIIIVVGLLFWGINASKAKDEAKLQDMLDTANAQIEQAKTQRSANIQELIAERDAIIEIIKNKFS